MAAGTNRRLHCDGAGVPDRVYRQPVAGLERMGLQRPAGQRPGADMPTVLSALAAGIPGRDYAGRLAAVLVVWGGTATLQISIEGMVLYVIETEFVERLTKVEERSKSNTHQINDLKPVIEEIHTMSKTMVELIGEVKHTNENVSELKDKVDILEKEPGKQWTATKRTFFTAMTSSIGTAVAAGILYLISKGGF